MSCSIFYNMKKNPFIGNELYPTQSINFGKFMDRLNFGSRKAIQRMPGHTFTKMPAAEVANWRRNMQGVVEKWKKETVDGAAVLKAFRAELAAVRSKTQ